MTRLTKTTRTRLTAIVTAAIEAGDTVTTLRKAIRDAHVFSRARAQLIARTEVVTVANKSQHVSMSAYADESGEIVEKAWLSARTNSPPVRPEHRALDNGEWRKHDEPFDNGLQTPGEPNCRCTAIYRIRSPE